MAAKPAACIRGPRGAESAGGAWRAHAPRRSCEGGSVAPLQARRQEAQCRLAEAEGAEAEAAVVRLAVWLRQAALAGRLGEAAAASSQLARQYVADPLSKRNVERSLDTRVVSGVSPVSVKRCLDGYAEAGLGTAGWGSTFKPVEADTHPGCCEISFGEST